MKFRYKSAKKMIGQTVQKSLCTTLWTRVETPCKGNAVANQSISFSFDRCNRNPLSAMGRYINQQHCSSVELLFFAQLQSKYICR